MIEQYSKIRIRARAFVATALVACVPAGLAAQGVTTAGVRGTVRADTRRQIDAQVRVSHVATGFSVEVRTTAGRFLVQGLEPGGPYTVSVRALGFAPQKRAQVFLKVGELQEIDLSLSPIATRLDTVTVAADGPAQGHQSDGGTRATITESMIDRLPTLDRDVHDLVRLVPQVSTKISLSNPGLSAGGVGFRFNNFLINGVSERSLSGGVSNAFAGARSIPLGAVREYQVLLSPYDVRYGDFAGALINAVTKSGTNTLEGSVFAYGRSDQIARRAAADSSPPYERAQYGFSVGGPLVRDRVHFFVAPELQQFTYSAAGPYAGQPPNASRPLPVSAADLDRFGAIMRGYGLTAGSAGPVANHNPLRNLFTRVDVGLPEWNSRLIVWNNYSGSELASFSRAPLDVFSLSSYQATAVAHARTTAVHAHTALQRAGGGHNELLVAVRSQDQHATGAVDQPIVRVLVPATAGGSIALNAGTDSTAQGSRFRSAAVSIKDNLTLPFGANHAVTLGVEVESFRVRRDGILGAYGTWTFTSLDSLALGAPTRYDLGIDLGTSIPLRGTHYTAYAGDQWQASNRLSLTGGVRADLLAIEGRAPYSAVVDTVFGRRTDRMPRRRVELSPRVGFFWDLSGRTQQHVRGGLGIFTSRYPLAWAQAALASYGLGGGQLLCSYLGSSDRYPPAFNPDRLAAPTTCGGGYRPVPSSDRDVDLLDRDLRMMRVARGSLAYERRVAAGLLFTNELLVTRALSDFILANLNLTGPQAIDRYGRVMYGTLDQSGAARPSRPSSSRFVGVGVTDLRNTSRNQSYQLSARLEKRHSSGASSFVSYTFSRVRDVQTLIRVNNRGITTWGSARATGGRHDDLTAGISSNDVPHRVVAAGTWVAPWTRARTELSFYYVGESGRPFTYTAFGTAGRGDLNADGSSINDPIYIPRSALDTLEMQFSGASAAAGADTSLAARTRREREQRGAFERLVARTPCLHRQRGRIMARNSCREPWSNLTIASVRQVVPVAHDGVEIQLDLFNVLNLLNADWGVRREATPALLEHVGQTAAPSSTARPIFRFNASAPTWTALAEESTFQLQVAVRYRF